MNFNIKLPEKQFYSILILCSIIILLNSLEVMINVKDISIYNEWIDGINISESLNTEGVNYYQLYLTSNLIYFFIKIIIPMALGIYTYFAFKYTRVNKIYVHIWAILLSGNLIHVIIEQKIDSIFYYINILCYIILITKILALSKLIQNSSIDKRWE